MTERCEFKAINSILLHSDLAGDEGYQTPSRDQADTKLTSISHMMTPGECQDLLSLICLKEPEIVRVDRYTSVVLPLHFGRMVIQSETGHWEENFESEHLICVIEFEHLMFNDIAGLAKLSQSLTWSIPHIENEKLTLRRVITLAEGRTDNSFLMEVSQLNQEAEMIWAQLSSRV